MPIRALRTPVLLWLPPLAFAGLLWFLSSLPADAMPEVPLVGWDKLAHLGAYAVLSRLLVSALERGGPGLAPGRAALWATALAGLYGVVDELHQGWFPERHRNASALDAVADVLGAALAAWLWARWRGRREPAGGGA